MRARLILQDGTVFYGESFGAPGEVFGEIVFNTGMTGYQEVLTDPSYCDQIVAMTYPLVGNYGCHVEAIESTRAHVRGFIVREWFARPQHYQSDSTLDEYLRREGVVGISGIDTRKLARVLREHGTLPGVLTTGAGPDEELLAQVRANDGLRDQVRRVTTPAPYKVPGGGRRVVLLDFGVKMNTLRSLRARDCDITVLPAYTGLEEILAWRPQGIMMSNGPGDPGDLPEIVETVRALVGRIPVFGICMGHQVLSLACGARTHKLRFGHRGVNHPVKELRSGRVYITSQNHGFVVTAESLAGTPLELTHINQNDGTVEGVRHKSAPAFSVQYHPEARPGPDDSEYLFDEFMRMIDDHRKGAGTHA